MDRRNFFKKASVASLGLIFAPAVARVLVEAEAEEIPQIRCGEGLWAYVQRKGVTKFYPSSGTVNMNDIMSGHHVTHYYNQLTSIRGLEALTKAMDHNQMFWLKLQAALENEKN